VKKLLLTAFTASMGLMAANAATVYVDSDIDVSTRWTADNEYVLEEVIYVRNGATLWIEPGTVIRGLEFDTADEDTTALWICRGGKLIAKGTKEKPIIFTDEFDNNFPWVAYEDIEPGYETINPVDDEDLARKSKWWGGLVMCGRAYIADGATGTSYPRLQESNAEGITPDGQGSTVYGGIDDDDCSGILSYVSVRYGGYVLSVASEVNGITLCGVGRGTQIDHIEVIGNQDDGIEFFGGTVNTKYVNISAIGDDSFDVDQGYRGRCQFLFIMQGYCNTIDGKFGGGWGNHAFEMDGVEDYADNQPWGMQRYENVTIIGMNTKGKNNDYLAGGDNNAHAMQLDDNCRAQFFNVIAADIDSYFAVLEDNSAEADDSADGLTTLATAANLPAVVNVAAGVASYAPYYYRSQNTNYNQCCFQNFVLYNCYSDGLATISNDANVPQTLIDTSSWNWNVAASLPIRYMERESASDPNRPMPSTYVGDPNVKLIDPRPVAAWTSSPYTPPADGFATPVNYYGAFAPSGPTWLDGWSALSTSRMLTNVVDETSAVTLDAVGFSVGADNVIVGVTYKLQESDAVSGPWSDVPGATAAATTTSMTLTDFDTAGDSSKFYRVITAD